MQSNPSGNIAHFEEQNAEVGAAEVGAACLMCPNSMEAKVQYPVQESYRVSDCQLPANASRTSSDVSICSKTLINQF